MREAIIYAEVYEILNILGKEYIEKIPIKFYRFIDDNRDKNFFVSYNINKPIEQQRISNEAIEFISLLNFKYWCSKEEQLELKKIYEQNELIYQERIKNNYIGSNFYSKHKDNVIQFKNINQEKSLIEKKENFFIKIMNKIKSFFQV